MNLSVFSVMWHQVNTKLTDNETFVAKLALCQIISLY